MSTTRCGSAAGFQSAREECECLLARPVCAAGRFELGSSRPAGSGVNGDKASMSVGELEVCRSMDLGPGIGRARIVTVVVADEAQFGSGNRSTSFR